jgi:hypothetical protein
MDDTRIYEKEGEKPRSIIVGTLAGDVKPLIEWLIKDCLNLLGSTSAMSKCGEISEDCHFPLRKNHSLWSTTMNRIQDKYRVSGLLNLICKITGLSPGLHKFHLDSAFPQKKSDNLHESPAHVQHSAFHIMTQFVEHQSHTSPIPV